jgi:hypothetical protein
MKVNTTVHVPWFDNALKAVAIPMYPLPAMRT